MKAKLKAALVTCTLLALAGIAAPSALAETSTGTAYATLDTNTGALVFHRGSPPATTATTRVYTGFETERYSSAGAVPWNTEAATIKSVSFAEEVAPTSTAHWFAGCSKLSSVDLNGLDTSQTTTMKAMFSGCSSLPTLDARMLDTSRVRNLESMFSSCASLVSLHVNTWDTSQVSNLFETFASCHALTALDLSGWDTSRVTNMSVTFADDEALQTVNLAGWDTSRVTDMHLMFYNCIDLRVLDLSSFDTSSVQDDVANSGFTGEYALFGYRNTEENPGLCRMLAKVTVGEKFAFKADGPLPAPDTRYIPGADGRWHAENGSAYEPGKLPSHTAATYYATGNYGSLVLPATYRDDGATAYVPLPSPQPTAPDGKKDDAKTRTVTVKTLSYNGAKATKATLSRALAKRNGRASTVRTVVLGKKVGTLGKRAFAGFKRCTALVIKTRKLTKKSVAKSLVGSKVKTIRVRLGSAKANRAYRAKYRAIFTKANAGQVVKIS